MLTKRSILSVSLLAATLIGCGSAPNGPNENAWRYLRGDVRSLTVPAFRSGRQCWIYLPPGYFYGGRRYPVLYMTDGHLIFDEMHVDRICEELIRRREIEPIIVVAITEPTYAVRVMDLTPPWHDSYEYLYPGGGADRFLSAIRDSLKPEIDRRYRTLRDPANTAVGGMSLGGLFATYAGFAHDSTFGVVAAFSPSYWWGDTMNIDRLIRSEGRPPSLQRLYQDTGYPDDNYILWTYQVLVSVGFVPGKDLMSVVVPGAEHVTGAWQNRFPQMLRFLFPPPG